MARAGTRLARPAAEVDAWVRDAATAPKPVYVLVGEPSEIDGPTQALVDALVPPARRAFNLDTYDGRTTPMSAVIDSLRTPGFLAATKVVWLRESTLFLSGEKRSDLTRSLLTAWEAGREREAAEKLVTLVALAGWSQEQFADVRWTNAPKTRVREVFGEELEAEELAQIEAAHAVCVARDLKVAAFRDDSGALLEFIDRGMPPHTVLLITASAADARKRVFKRLHDIGACLVAEVERERSGALARDSVDDVVDRVLGAHGKRLIHEARDVLVRRAGADPGMLAAEVEKLCLYVGDRTAVTADDVRVVVRDMAGSWIFDFTAALASRKLAVALPLVRGLFEQGEPPLRLLGMVAREMRVLLLARECLDGPVRERWRADLSFGAFQTRVAPGIDGDTLAAFGKPHPFVLYRRFQDAARLSAPALRTALVRLSELDQRLKSSRGDPALLLEWFVIEWCRPSRAAAS